ncbi:50S ribosomal protein L25/general stress protein Ctc [Enterococcus dongliensis]|uniref:Large ribosomal subunit protein bL25 n=1 Tax=Enterococcus dongliensis TaxID=2559925 RepID=A0AAP5KPC3_9ENTE|nr:50S ribosomal protein L25/general stress protein Ctc [Enterococcus dongliensis]MDT2596114.1 50S ribosomal protein L25/general stress protein Ctc [Enterococcus dongliensis]MDT2603834.1 50S ribosomal protein L25/general stress protein Ctc [Enterococcus dongliensis]MDT2612832.1 50S ribosomal protein L25/general stress protein Ctc [Enterococcus dongliensis]MDT2634269.1 50S ribosomal protein L25/general stress protein Ctc [Enterococcus dongliensis]MDT2637199.1 50S ribosomal protein L25/general s
MAVSLKVEERATRPRSIRNKLRHEGKVPAIVNGYQVESTPISIDEREFSRLLRENGANTVFAIEIGGKKVNTLLRESQLDTFTRHLTHVELVSVNLSEETEAETEINLVGEAAGVKAGGVLTQTLYTVTVSATPEKLPEGIDVDISGLEIGQALAISDLPKNTDYTIVTDAEEQIVAIQEAQELSEEEATEGAEPEVIGQATEE